MMPNAGAIAGGSGTIPEYSAHTRGNTAASHTTPKRLHQSLDIHTQNTDKRGRGERSLCRSLRNFSLHLYFSFFFSFSFGES